MFSIRWTGQIEGQYDETYTFYTNSDDGVRLWINGDVVIDNWTDHSATANNGTYVLKAGQKYDIKMTYYNNTQEGVASLAWSSASTAKQIIPTSQLYSDTNVRAPPAQPPVTPPVTPPVVTPPTTPTTPTDVGNVTITVDKNGSIKTIQQAIDQAKAGDVILIKNGTYHEGINITKSGTADKRITLVAESIGGVIIDGSGINYGINGRNSNYITIKGVKLVNVNNGVQNENAALRVGANWYVEDVVVDQSAGAAVGVLGSNSTLVPVTASNAGQIGIGGSYISNVLIKDCNSFGNNTKGYDPVGKPVAASSPSPTAS